MIDIVIPKDNEDEFKAMAKKLRIQQLVFLYPSKGFLAGGKKEVIATKAGKNLRQVIENSPVEVIFGLEEMSGSDFLHHRASGLNQVLCNLLNKKNKMIGFSFSSLLRASPLKRAQIIGRMRQNFRLCRKYKVKTVIASFARNPYEMRGQADLAGLFLSLGMDPGMVKASFERIKR